MMRNKFKRSMMEKTPIIILTNVKLSNIYHDYLSTKYVFKRVPKRKKVKKLKGEVYKENRPKVLIRTTSKVVTVFRSHKPSKGYGFE